MALNYTPRVYMWIVTYKNNEAIPQFDPNTGKENKLRDVDLTNAKKAGYFPITPLMAIRILQGEGIVTIPKEIPIYEIDLKQGQKPVIKIRNMIPPGQYHECLECHHKWIFSFGKENKTLKRKGCPWASDHKLYCVTCASEGKNTELERRGDMYRCPKGEEHRTPAPLRRYQVSVCPSCGYHNLPTDSKEDHRIIQKVKDMSYVVYLLGVEGEKILEINEWGEIINGITNNCKRN